MSQTFTNILYHVIFSTKQRDPLIAGHLKTDFYDYIGGILRKEKAMLITIGGIEDHVHLVVRARASHCVSNLVRKIKSNSSKWMNTKLPKDEIFAWQNGFAAFSVSESQLPNLIRYVGNQENHHKIKNFNQELSEFLIKQKINFKSESL